MASSSSALGTSLKILIASYLSRIMAKPLEKLSADILLVVQLNHLINEVLIAQIEQQKSLINV